jgi:hypothetical protein
MGGDAVALEHIPMRLNHLRALTVVTSLRKGGGRIALARSG